MLNQLIPELWLCLFPFPCYIWSCQKGTNRRNQTRTNFQVSDYYYQSQLLKQSQKQKPDWSHSPHYLIILKNKKLPYFTFSLDKRLGLLRKSKLTKIAESHINDIKRFTGSKLYLTLLLSILFSPPPTTSTFDCDYVTRTDNKIYGVSNFRCTATFTRTRFRIKRYTVLKSENSSFQWYQIQYGAFKLSWCKS